MSSQFIDPTLVTTPVKVTTIDNVAVVDVHALSSEWKHYLVTFTPLQPGPVRLVLRLYNRSEGPELQPCSQADLEGFASAQVHHLVPEMVRCLVCPPRAGGTKRRVHVDKVSNRVQQSRDVSRVRKLSQTDLNENMAPENTKRLHTGV